MQRPSSHVQLQPDVAGQLLRAAADIRSAAPDGGAAGADELRSRLRQLESAGQLSPAVAAELLELTEGPMAAGQAELGSAIRRMRSSGELQPGAAAQLLHATFVRGPGGLRDSVRQLEAAGQLTPAAAAQLLRAVEAAAAASQSETAARIRELEAAGELRPEVAAQLLQPAATSSSGSPSELRGCIRRLESAGQLSSDAASRLLPSAGSPEQLREQVAQMAASGQLGQAAAAQLLQALEEAQRRADGGGDRAALQSLIAGLQSAGQLPPSAAAQLLQAAPGDAGAIRDMVFHMASVGDASPHAAAQLLQAVSRSSSSAAGRLPDLLQQTAAALESAGPGRVQSAEAARVLQLLTAGGDAAGGSGSSDVQAELAAAEEEVRALRAALEDCGRPQPPTKASALAAADRALAGGLPPAAAAELSAAAAALRSAPAADLRLAEKVSAVLSLVPTSSTGPIVTASPSAISATPSSQLLAGVQQLVTAAESGDAGSRQLLRAVVALAADGAKPSVSGEERRLQVEASLAAAEAEVKLLREAASRVQRSDDAENEIVAGILQERREMEEKLGAALAEGAGLRARLAGCEVAGSQAADAAAAAARAEANALRSQISASGVTADELRDAARKLLQEKRQVEARLEKAKADNAWAASVLEEPSRRDAVLALHEAASAAEQLARDGSLPAASAAALLAAADDARLVPAGASRATVAACAGKLQECLAQAGAGNRAARPALQKTEAALASLSAEVSQLSRQRLHSVRSVAAGSPLPDDSGAPAALPDAAGAQAAVAVTKLTHGPALRAAGDMSATGLLRDVSPLRGAHGLTSAVAVSGPPTDELARTVQRLEDERAELEARNANLAEQVLSAASRLRSLESALDQLCATAPWECGGCMYENDPDAVVCEMCSQPRPSSEPPSRLASAHGTPLEGELLRLKTEAGSLRRQLSSGPNARRMPHDDGASKDVARDLLREKGRLQEDLTAARAEAAELRKLVEERAGGDSRSLTEALMEARAELSALRGGLDVLTQVDDGYPGGAPPRPLSEVSGPSRRLADLERENESLTATIAELEKGVRRERERGNDALRRLDEALQTTSAVAAGSGGALQARCDELRQRGAELAREADLLRSENQSLRSQADGQTSTAGGLSVMRMRSTRSRAAVSPLPGEDAADSAVGSTPLRPRQHRDSTVADLLDALDAAQRVGTADPQTRSRLQSIRSLAATRPLPTDDICGMIDALPDDPAAKDELRMLKLEASLLRAAVQAHGSGADDDSDHLAAREEELRQALQTLQVSGALLSAPPELQHRVEALVSPAQDGRDSEHLRVHARDLQRALQGVAADPAAVESLAESDSALPVLLRAVAESSLPGGGAALRRTVSQLRTVATRVLGGDAVAGVPVQQVCELQSALASADGASTAELQSRVSEMAELAEALRSGGVPSRAGILSPPQEHDDRVHALQNRVRELEGLLKSSAMPRLGSDASALIASVDEALSMDGLPPRARERLRSVRSMAASGALPGTDMVSEFGSAAGVPDHAHDDVQALNATAASSHHVPAEAAVADYADRLQQVLRGLAASGELSGLLPADVVRVADHSPPPDADADAVQTHLDDLQRAARAVLQSPAGAVLPPELTGELEAVAAAAPRRLSGGGTTPPQSPLLEMAEKDRQIALLTEEVERLRAGTHPASDPPLSSQIAQLLHAHADVGRQVGDEMQAALLEAVGETPEGHPARGSMEQLLDGTAPLESVHTALVSAAEDPSLPETVRERLRAAADAREYALRSEAEDLRSALAAAAAAGADLPPDLLRQRADDLRSLLSRAPSERAGEALLKSLRDEIARLESALGVDCAAAMPDDVQLLEQRVDELRAAADECGVTPADPAALQQAVAEMEECAFDALQPTRTADDAATLGSYISGLRSAVEAAAEAAAAADSTGAGRSAGVPQSVPDGALAAQTTDDGTAPAQQLADCRRALQAVLSSTGTDLLPLDVLNLVRSILPDTQLTPPDSALASTARELVETIGLSESVRQLTARRGSAGSALSKQLDPAVAVALRTALRSDDVPEAVRRGLSTAFSTADGATEPLVLAADSALLSGLPHSAVAAVDDIAAAADHRAAALGAAASAALRAGLGSPELAAAAEAADNALRAVAAELRRAAAMPGLPADTRRALTAALVDTAGGLEATLRAAVRECAVPDGLQRELSAALRGGDGIAVETAARQLLASGSASGLSTEARRALDDAVNAEPVDGAPPLLAHTRLPAAARLALRCPDLPDSVRRSLAEALALAAGRADLLSKALAAAAEVADSAGDGQTAKRLRSTLTSAGDAWEPSAGEEFQRTQTGELSAPSVREVLRSVLADPSSERLPVFLRRRLEMLHRAGGDEDVLLAALSPGDAAQVVVLEPPGAGDWLDCDVQERLSDGTYRIRVRALPPRHPAARFGGRLLRVAGEHLRTVQPPADALPVGTRVVRNPHHWRGGSQDGGGLGTVTSCDGGWATVSWDAGRQGRHRWGSNGAYELRPAAPPPRPPVYAGDRVVRDPVHWRGGDEDGGAGQLGTVTSVGDGWVTVAWDAGRDGQYVWGAGGVWEVVRAPAPAQTNLDEDGLRAALRSALGSGAGDALPEALSQRLWATAGAASPRRKVAHDIHHLVGSMADSAQLSPHRSPPPPGDADVASRHAEEAALQQVAALEQEVWRLRDALSASRALLQKVEPHADGFPAHLRAELRARSGRLQSPSETSSPAHGPPPPAPQPADVDADADVGVSDDEERDGVRARLSEAEDLLRIVTGPGADRSPDLARRLAAFAAQPPPRARKPRRRWGGRRLLSVLRGELSSRDAVLHERLRELMQQPSSPHGAHPTDLAADTPLPVGTTPADVALALPAPAPPPETADVGVGDGLAELSLRDAGAECCLEPASVDTDADFADERESLRQRLDTERGKVRELQQQLLVASIRPVSAVQRPPLDADPVLQRRLRALNLLPPDARMSPPRAEWVDRVVASARADPELRANLPANFGREGGGHAVQFGDRQLDIVRVNEFPAVRVGGGYMLFPDFVRRFGTNEGKQVLVSRGGPAEPQALVRQGGQMVFVDPPADNDPQPIYAAGVGPGGGARSPSPRRTRCTFEPCYDDAEADATDSRRRTHEHTSPSPTSRQSRSGVPTLFTDASPTRPIARSPLRSASPSRRRVPGWQVEEMDDTEVIEDVDTDGGGPASPRPAPRAARPAAGRGYRPVQPPSRGRSSPRGRGRVFPLATHPTMRSARTGSTDASAYLSHRRSSGQSVGGTRASRQSSTALLPKGKFPPRPTQQP